MGNCSTTGTARVNISGAGGLQPIQTNANFHAGGGLNAQVNTGIRADTDMNIGVNVDTNNRVRETHVEGGVNLNANTNVRTNIDTNIIKTDIKTTTINANLTGDVEPMQTNIHIDINSNDDNQFNFNSQYNTNFKTDVNFTTYNKVEYTLGCEDYHCEECKHLPRGKAILVEGKDPNDSRQWDEREFKTLPNNREFFLDSDGDGIPDVFDNDPHNAQTIDIHVRIGTDEELPDEEISQYSDDGDVINLGPEEEDGENFFDTINGGGNINVNIGVTVGGNTNTQISFPSNSEIRIFDKNHESHMFVGHNTTESDHQVYSCQRLIFNPDSFLVRTKFSITSTQDGYYQIMDSEHQAFLFVGKDLDDGGDHIVWACPQNSWKDYNDFMLRTSFSIVAAEEGGYRILDRNYNSYLFVGNSEEMGDHTVYSVPVDKFNQNPSEWARRTVFAIEGTS